jgi:DNA-directed RNA polymerase
MKQKLVESLSERAITEISDRSKLNYLKTVDFETHVDLVISVVYLYTRPNKKVKNKAVFLSEMIGALGHALRNKLKIKRDSSLAAKTGGFILYSFEELRMIQVLLGVGQQGHNSYIVQVENDEDICDLWSTLAPNTVDKLPATKPYAPWETTRHPSGAMLVKTQDKTVHEQISVETHPHLFSCVNKSQEVGWRINKEIYDLHLWALRNKAHAFDDIWTQQNPEARTTKLREARCVGDIAKKFLDEAFYHLYYYDFRGRKYPTTAYLHEQGADLARGLLMRDQKKAIGIDGYFWLMVSIASNWAGDSGREDGRKTDKIPLQDRALWVLDNEEIILSYAESPKLAQGWMKADKPWQFLAACIELRKLREWQHSVEDFDSYNYSSHLEVYIDGTNNGSQHLAALMRDEVTAPYVNLVAQELPGDLYSYVADHVWEILEQQIVDLTPDERLRCEEFIDNLIELKKRINTAELNSDLRKELILELRALRNLNEEILDICCPVFWLRISDTKHKRKIVKRNTMTIPYGGTAYGLGQQIIIDSKKHGIPLLLFLEHKWGSFLGREVLKDCKICLKRPMDLLGVFERAGKAAEAKGEYLSWTAPITNFPVVQYYVEGVVKKIWVQYGPPIGEKLNTGYYENTLQMQICFIEKPRPSKGKQSQGASPNIIHSFDAAHLTLTVAQAKFPVTTIHDSFGCLLSDMPELYTLIRETFVEVYKENPLDNLLKEIGGDISELDIGDLDVTEILHSEYCFS